VSVQVETLGSGSVPDQRIAELLERNLISGPAGIVQQFNLRCCLDHQSGFYRKLAAYGHVGRMDIGLPGR